jgi:hypothetical protein
MPRRMRSGVRATLPSVRGSPPLVTADTLSDVLRAVRLTGAV